MNILHVTTKLGNDGPGKGLKALVKYSISNSHKIFIHSLCPITYDECFTSKKDLIPISEYNLSFYNFVQAYVEVRNIIKTNRVDLVHTHLSRADWIGRIAAYHEKVPSVSSIRNVHSSMYRDLYPYGLHMVAELLDDITVKYSSGLIALSSEIFNSLTIKYPFVDNYEILNSVDINMADKYLDHTSTIRKELNVDKSTILFGTCANFNLQKNYSFYLEAINNIRSFLKNVKFVWLGDGPLLNDIRYKINEYKLEDIIILTGNVRNPFPYLKQMNLFVLPSRYEGLPRAMMEAMCFGIPCIGTNVSGINDLIIENETGWLVPSNDPLLLGQTIIEAIESQNKWAKYGINARKLILDKFSAKKSAEAHIALYSNIIKAFNSR
jgi:glycosyltransferase involved in cell wall biosynthesis